MMKQIDFIHKNSQKPNIKEVHYINGSLIHIMVGGKENVKQSDTFKNRKST
jgi:hypothetical protein